MRRENRATAVARLDQPALLQSMFYADRQEAEVATGRGQLIDPFSGRADWARIET
jgi:hypothetical protein